MRIALFCEQKYAISILFPLQEEAAKGGHDVLWFVDARNIPDFPRHDEVVFTNDMQTLYDFSPEAIFVPGNIVPYYLPGVKIEIFHGYAAEKKGHWIIRHYLDLYLTQGPYFTERFRRLAVRHGDFEVVETGWTRQDWIHQHLHDFDAERQQLLRDHGRRQVALYAPTFSPSLTSLPFLEGSLRRLVAERDVLLLIKLHPLTRPEWVEAYRRLAGEVEHAVWIDDHALAKYILISDVVISDTSSALYEALLADKPVVAFNNAVAAGRWMNFTDADALLDAFDGASSDAFALQRQQLIAAYDPHRDGLVSRRMIEAAADYIARRGVPKERKLNPWRRYQCIKKFGKIKKRKG
ncbi:MAG: CDP-glycerol glycerophosphotransferase family protein [Odoribacteraceae bacterium]|jgi:CDP-glycerol glycerophosphotransferase (TagB/SpsB family)|nr:CDP-glycerol glycerophosphotransferase family protein [Odoribacteraceae bacterium]